MKLRVLRDNRNSAAAFRAEFRALTRNCHKITGFTLVELLVVIAVIGILCALLLPSLSKAKQKAKTVNCVSNLDQMQLAWSLYANDSDDHLVPNRGYNQVTPKNYYENWAAGNVMSLPDETNGFLLANSLLGRYTKNISIYRCPSDPGSPVGTLRVRSFSMNNYMNGTGIDILSNNFVYNTKLLQIPHPADAFVFLDESPRTINDCYFAVEMTTNYYAVKVHDMPANNHSAAGFSFADGHAVAKSWRTALFQNPPFFGMSALVSAPQNEDALWLMQHATVPTSGQWP